MSDDQTADGKTPNKQRQEKRQEKIQQKARELARQQGLEWKGMTKEQRHGLKVQVRDGMKARRQARQSSAE